MVIAAGKGRGFHSGITLVSVCFRQLFEALIRSFPSLQSIKVFITTQEPPFCVHSPFSLLFTAFPRSIAHSPPWLLNYTYSLTE